MTALASLIVAVGSALSAAHVKPLTHERPAPLRPALASWYDDSGTTASGVHYRYGYASLLFGGEWGHRVDFCYRDQCVTGQLDDHGPYVSGRLFDLSARLRAAVGCPDLCYLGWRNHDH